MSEPFNAYKIWLDIPLEEQPPHYYQLLGVRVFETDQQAIASAACQVSALLSAHRGGEYHEIADQLLQQLREAQACLLDPELKARYDRALSLGQPLEGIRPEPQSFEVGAEQVLISESAISLAALDYVQQLVQPQFQLAPLEAAPLAQGERYPNAAPAGSGQVAAFADIPRHSRRRALPVQPIMIVLGGLIGLTVGYFVAYYLQGHDIFQLLPPRQPLLPSKQELSNSALMPWQLPRSW